MHANHPLPYFVTVWYQSIFLFAEHHTYSIWQYNWTISTVIISVLLISVWSHCTSTGQCHYNMANILQTTWIILKRHPISRQWGWGMGWLLWDHQLVYAAVVLYSIFCYIWLQRHPIIHHIPYISDKHSPSLFVMWHFGSYCTSHVDCLPSCI